MGTSTLDNPTAAESSKDEDTAKGQLVLDERPTHQTRKSRHQSSKSGPVPADLKLADLQIPNVTAGPSRLPSRHRPEALSPGQPAAQADLSQDLKKPQPEVPDVSLSSEESTTAAQALPAEAIHASAPSYGNSNRPTESKQVYGKPSKKGHKQQGSTAHGSSSDFRQNRLYIHASHQGSGGSGNYYPEPPLERQQRGPRREREPVPLDCRNRYKAGLFEDYLSCDCSRCERQSRSIYITGLNVHLTAAQKIDMLERYYSRWGKVEDCELSHNIAKRLPLWAALVTFESTEPVAATVQHTNNTEIPGLSNRARVSFPFYSRFYKKPQHHASYDEMRRRTSMTGPPHIPVQPLSPEDVERLAQQYHHQCYPDQHGAQQHQNPQQPPNPASAAVPPVPHKAALPNSKSGKRRPSGFSESKIGFSDGSPRIVKNQPVLADPFVGESMRRVCSGMLGGLEPPSTKPQVIESCGEPRIPSNGYSNVPHVPSPSGHPISQPHHGYPPQYGHPPPHGQFIPPRGQPAGFRFGPSDGHPGYFMPQPGHSQLIHAPPPYSTTGAPGVEVGAGGRNPYAPSFQPTGPPGMYAPPYPYPPPPPHWGYPNFPMPMGYGLPPHLTQFPMDRPPHRQAYAPQDTPLPATQQAMEHNMQSKQSPEEALPNREKSPELNDNLGRQDIRIRLPNRPTRTPPKQIESPSAGKTKESAQPSDIRPTLDQSASSGDEPEFIKEALAALGSSPAPKETAVAEEMSTSSEEQKEEPKSVKTADSSLKPEPSRYRYASQDIRMEPDFMNQTVIRRRPYERHPVFLEWQDQDGDAATEGAATVEGVDTAAQAVSEVSTLHQDAATNQF
ncbi:hypothetical protein B0H67DRAFT_18394 [Lasiosphaeris hirsuta]|uniref:RRM domain-containing protein n=1 Tax=Lasiosphaeris hirsuta TaxID=260670 RepID=A0AA40E6F1_9PEZI|nr:hypothetical protein B0H67DRAFT_18394 [Lasiosphaeris hirsuta]